MTASQEILDLHAARACALREDGGTLFSESCQNSLLEFFRSALMALALQGGCSHDSGSDSSSLWQWFDVTVSTPGGSSAGVAPEGGREGRPEHLKQKLPEEGWKSDPTSEAIAADKAIAADMAGAVVRAAAEAECKCRPVTGGSGNACRSDVGGQGPSQRWIFAHSQACGEVPPTPNSQVSLQQSFTRLYCWSKELKLRGCWIQIEIAD